MKRDLDGLRAKLRCEIDQIESVTPCRSNAAGLVGNGWVGETRSPGTSACGTGRSSIGHSGSPVTRSKTNRKACFVHCATARIFRPSTVGFEENRRDGMSQSQTSWCTS